MGLLEPPLFPCGGDTGGVFPEPPAAPVCAVNKPPPPPPEPPGAPVITAAPPSPYAPPPPPPVEVIDEKIDGVPFPPRSSL
jgi:hypothetical protein